MKEEWLLNGAVVPVTCETVTELVLEIKRLIGVVGGMALAQPEPDWGAVGEAHLVSLKRDMRASLEVAAFRATHKVMAEQPAQPAQRTWVGLTDEEIEELRLKTLDAVATNHKVYQAIEAKLKEKNND